MWRKSQKGFILPQGFEWPSMDGAGKKQSRRHLDGKRDTEQSRFWISAPIQFEGLTVRTLGPAVGRPTVWMRLVSSHRLGISIRIHCREAYSLTTYCRRAYSLGPRILISVSIHSALSNQGVTGREVAVESMGRGGWGREGGRTVGRLGGEVQGGRVEEELEASGDCKRIKVATTTPRLTFFRKLF